MLKRYMSQMHREQKGITGLETAIILIAFVVVASVFAYTVLSAGLFAAERGREAVHAGLEGARAAMELRGGVIAKAPTDPGGLVIGNVTGLTFTVSSTLGGEPVNFTPPTGNTTNLTVDENSPHVVVISYIDEDQHKADLLWTKTPIGDDDGDDLLEEGEKFQITIGGTTVDKGLMGALDPDLTKNKTFTIVIKPPVGADLSIERTIPAVIDAVMNLN
ncbi:hypothetical protein M1O52_01450 [Dehalococcoidia bacterium]|nr:hypothetical protein [Dehalococcoidia bacterium]